ncbi:alkaline phosphatase family protein [Paludicola sp. MB14-C6]|uniref:alkaline phosphatase family protein n=1 Tax=Paludihabitans sp. MB14-C6 TaxID=3070656 RepID=UPI0027DAEAF3|nr:alkaline phosphatase family protein [Paludicola sp. MB14-C6]WMJ22051.1 alkaline phosphatase family protein [Paludicola sp. MB14-C6]
MKVIFVIIDGAERSDYESLTLNQYTHEHLLLNNTPMGMNANSLTCILNILGVPHDKIPKGRAYLEALASNINIDQNDIVFRCNGVEIQNNVLVSSCKEVNTTFVNNQVQIIPLGGYKNLLMIKNSKECFDSISTYEPHNNIGKNINSLLPTCSNMQLQNLLQELILKNNLWAWGQAVQTDLPSFNTLHHKNGAIVCKTEIVKGIAKAMGMECPDMKNATAETNTDLKEKADMTLKLSQIYDFTMLHINGADEAAHRKNADEKHAFIQRIDQEVISYLIKNIDQDTALIVTSDHVTDVKTGEHKNEPTDCFILNKNKECEQWLKR